jgi:hypothetical protein
LVSGEGEAEAEDAARLGLPGLLPVAPCRQAVLRRVAAELLLVPEDLREVLSAEHLLVSFLRVRSSVR